tara:strand:+ start:104 stop:436 length:333 start_codon:yes stop_codon:yes gene_type:complete
MSKNILTFCKTSISKLKNIKETHKCKSVLIGVKSGGCNGFKYFIEPTNDTPQKLDEQIKIDDLQITVCGKSIFFLLGTHVTWKNNIMGEGFEFNNPNSKSSCGCGETFSI